jgi:hypothetical protein
MLGMLPDLVDMPAINQALAIPLQPGRPPGAMARGPATIPAVDAPKPIGQETKPGLTVPATMLPPVRTRPVPDIRHQTLLQAPVAARPVMAVSLARPVAAR